MRLYGRFLIYHKFYTAAQIQMTAKSESASFGSTNVVWTYAVIFTTRHYPGSVG